MGIRKVIALGLLAGLLVPTLTAAASEESPTGLAALRDKLADRGLTLHLSYIGELYAVAAGGLHRQTAYLDNISLTLGFDLGKAIGWRGATLYFYGMSLQGRNPSLAVGDVQGVSNIGAFPTSKLYEAWIEQSLFGDRLSLLAGLYDLNSEFAVIESSGVFLNSSQAIDPAFAKSGPNGPSIFPNTTLGFRARYSPDRRFYLQSVVLNGVAGDPDHPSGTRIELRKSDGVLVAAEAGWVFWRSGKAPLRLNRRRTVRVYEKPEHGGKLALGLWTYTAKFAPVFRSPGAPQPPPIGGDHGLYVLFSHTVLADDDNPERHMSVFARLGAANRKVNRLDAYLGAGVVFDGPFTGRSNDVAGLAFAVVRNGRDYMETRRLGGERTDLAEWDLESTYRARLSSWLSVQPDVQFVVHPNTNPTVASALGVDLRVSASF